jgi:hypothetical protein
MPDPLPSDVVCPSEIRLHHRARSLILAGSFPDIVSRALRAFSKSGEPKATPASRRQYAVKSDKALLAVMRANPGASLADLIQLGRRPRASTVASLNRLEDAGLVEHPGKGVYKAVGQAPTPKTAWTEPLGGRHIARHAADGRVRDEMTMT